MMFLGFRTWNEEKGMMEKVRVLDVRKMRNLMQATGVLDKNGVMIYEGDILRSAVYDHECPVTFENCSFGLNGLSLNLCGIETYEIVGNVFQLDQTLPDRPLEFRKWDKEKKRFTRIYKLDLENEEEMQYVAQYSGLKDKKRKKIYVGHTFSFGRFGTLPVVFKEGMFAVQGKGTVKPALDDLFLYNYHHRAIAGNIFEEALACS